MYQRSLPLAAFVLAISALCQRDFAVAATRIDLVVDEPFADRTAPWPMTTGVPFPRGALNDM